MTLFLEAQRQMFWGGYIAITGGSQTVVLERLRVILQILYCFDGRYHRTSVVEYGLDDGGGGGGGQYQQCLIFQNNLMLRWMKKHNISFQPNGDKCLTVNKLDIPLNTIRAWRRTAPFQVQKLFAM